MPVGSAYLLKINENRKLESRSKRILTLDLSKKIKERFRERWHPKLRETLHHTEGAAANYDSDRRFR